MKKTISILTIILLQLACSNIRDPQVSNTEQIDLTSTSLPTKSPESTFTPKPTSTPEPTPTLEPFEIEAGTYIIGEDIPHGLYTGHAGSSMDEACYISIYDSEGIYISGIIAVGKFYFKINLDDYSMETGCSMTYMPTLPEPVEVFPTNIPAGTYLVNIDIQPGIYQGHAGNDGSTACVWRRHANIPPTYEYLDAGKFLGEFTLQVEPGDLVLTTFCDLVRIGDAVSGYKPTGEEYVQPPLQGDGPQ